MINPQQMQDGRVKIVDGGWILRRLVANLISRAILNPGFYAGSRHPAAESMLMMVSANPRSSLCKRRATEFRHPQQQSIFQQATLSEIAQESSDRLIQKSCLLGMVFNNVLMSIPVDASDPRAPPL